MHAMSWHFSCLVLWVVLARTIYPIDHMPVVIFMVAIILALCSFPAQAAAEEKRFLPLKKNRFQLDQSHKFISLHSGSPAHQLGQYQSGRSFSLKDYKPRIYRKPTPLPFGKRNKRVYQEHHESPSHYNKAVTQKDSYSWPLDPEAPQYISSPFGYRSDPFTRERAYHAGIDIAAQKGTAVLAAAEGVVSRTGSHPRLGKFVRIDHAENEYSLYGHLSKIHVMQGQNIDAREQIGQVGSTGRSTGPHLDFSIRKNGEAVNPEKYLPPFQDRKLAFLQ